MGTLEFTILGCGSSGGVPRADGDWGACDPSEPKNRRSNAFAIPSSSAAVFSGVGVTLVCTRRTIRCAIVRASILLRASTSAPRYQSVFAVKLFNPVAFVFASSAIAQAVPNKPRKPAVNMVLRIESIFLGLDPTPRTWVRSQWRTDCPAKVSIIGQPSGSRRWVHSWIVLVRADSILRSCLSFPLTKSSFSRASF